MTKTKFWNYFWNTIKESKWLLLRFLVVGLYLIIVGIIANRLNLNDLTFYNSMLTLCYLGEMIAFGFSEGFGIYINQHISELDKSKKYAKLGLYFTFGLMLAIAILFACLPNFVVKNILNLDFEVNLVFYYLMIVAMIFMTIFSYINLLLKKVGSFKFQLITSFVQALLITLSMTIILLTHSLMLIPIGIIYILVHIICIIVGHILLTKNKQFKINLFKCEKIHLTRQELKVVIARALSEIIWEVGYVFISLFILKVDVVAYNQYCYYENALDILNGLFFTIVSVISIKICRCIGEGKKEEAKLHANYSIKATFVVWIIYAIISLCLFIPLRNGMNIELQNTAFLSLSLYLSMSLFRFIEWNLGTYILGQSEFFAKGGLILETIFMFYWIGLYLIATFIPVNIIVIYSLIAFENLIKIIVSICVYKNPKWLDKSE